MDLELRLVGPVQSNQAGTGKLHHRENMQLITDLGGTPFRDTLNEKFASTLRCHDANGEIYFVNFSRDLVTLTSFSDDAIKSRVETWADTVAALA